MVLNVLPCRCDFALALAVSLIVWTLATCGNTTMQQCLAGPLSERVKETVPCFALSIACNTKSKRRVARSLALVGSMRSLATFSNYFRFWLASASFERLLHSRAARGRGMASRAEACVERLSPFAGIPA